MSAEIQSAKDALRRTMLAQLAKHPLDEQTAASERIRQRLVEHYHWREARSVLFYSAIRGEPDLNPLISQALKAGKTIALPRYVASRQCYEAAQIIDPQRDLRPGMFGVPEPVKDAPVLPLNQLDLALVPGVGFDQSGRRLGRGKGYYDRLLPGVRGIKCGVAFDFQVIAQPVPAESHDIYLDCILTPSRWWFVAPRTV